MASLGIYSAEAFQPAKIIKKINKKPWSDIIAVVSHSWCLCFFLCVCYSSTPVGDLDDWDMPEHAISFRKSGSTFNKGIKQWRLVILYPIGSRFADCRSYGTCSNDYRILDWPWSFVLRINILHTAYVETYADSAVPRSQWGCGGSYLLAFPRRSNVNI